MAFFGLFGSKEEKEILEQKKQHGMHEVPK